MNVLSLNALMVCGESSIVNVKSFSYKFTMIKPPLPGSAFPTPSGPTKDQPSGGSCVFVGLGVEVAVLVGVVVDEGVGVLVRVAVAVGVCVRVALAVGVFVAVAVAVGGICVGVADSAFVGVFVGAAAIAVGWMVGAGVGDAHAFRNKSAMPRTTRGITCIVFILELVSFGCC